MRNVHLTLLLACHREPPPPPRVEPVVAVVVPLSGEGAARGQRALEGARVALADRYVVEGVDDTGPAAIQALEARPEVVAALAHQSTRAADAGEDTWLAGDLPVILLTASTQDRLPRAVPGPAELGICATALIGGRRVALVHDGSESAMVVVAAMQQALGRRAATLLALDPSDLATDIGRLRKGRYDGIAYAGATDLGGDLLRSLRGQGVVLPFQMVGGSAETLFAAAGPAAGVAQQIAPDRAPFFSAGIAHFAQTLGVTPSGPARNAYDAAALVGAALDIVPTDERGLPERPAVRAAFEQVIGVGLGGPLALQGGHPAPAQCTAYGSQGGTLTLVAAAQVGTDGTSSRLSLEGDQEAQ